MPIVTTTTTVADASGGIKTTTTTQSSAGTSVAPAPAPAAKNSVAPAAAVQGPTRFVLSPNEACPRWPEGAADVMTVPQVFNACVANNADRTVRPFFFFYFSCEYDCSEDVGTYTPFRPMSRLPLPVCLSVCLSHASLCLISQNSPPQAMMRKMSKDDTTWTSISWQGYSDNVVATGKAMIAAGVAAADTVNILAFNSPEWFFACVAAINIGSVSAGIYGSNNEDGVKYVVSGYTDGYVVATAYTLPFSFTRRRRIQRICCFSFPLPSSFFIIKDLPFPFSFSSRYVAAHSKAKIIFVDSCVQLAKVQAVRGSLPDLKLVVLWPDSLTADSVPPGAAGEGVVSWSDFLASGNGITDAAYDARVAACDPAKACFLSYTSGTTGNPKAVMHSHDTLLHASRSVWGRINQSMPEGQKMGRDERTVSYLPMSHVAGSLNVFMQLLTDEQKDVIYFAFPDALKGSLGATLKDVKPTMFTGVPRVWEKFHAALAPALGPGGPLHGKPVQYAQGALGLSAMKLGLVGAAPVSKETMDFFDNLEKPIYELYGMTENFALYGISLSVCVCV